MAKYTADYYLDSVGRRRKLSAGAMISIQNAFAEGVKPADLAHQYGVSTSLIRVIVYMTPRVADVDRIRPGVVHVIGTEDDTK